MAAFRGITAVSSSLLATALASVVTDRTGRPSAAAKTAGRCGRITPAGFGKHGFRHNQVEAVASRPPLNRDLLVRGLDQVAAGTRGEVAQDRGLDVDAGLHGVCLLLLDRCAILA